MNRVLVVSATIATILGTATAASGQTASKVMLEVPAPQAP